jgi:hypothetical protein
MYEDNKNEYGCPLFEQNGQAGIRDFDAIVARLAPELRLAFEAERAARCLELKRGGRAGYLERWEYRRVVTQLQRLWIAQPHLHIDKDALAEQIGQLRPWLRAWQPTAERIGAAAARARCVQGIPNQMRRLREQVPTYRPDALVTRAAAIPPLGRWIDLVDSLLDHGGRSGQFGRAMRGQRAVNARLKGQ